MVSLLRKLCACVLVAACGQGSRDAADPSRASDPAARPTEDSGRSAHDAGGPTSGAGGPLDAATIDGSAAALVCDAAGFRVLRVAGWPGGGVQLALQLREPASAPAAD